MSVQGASAVSYGFPQQFPTFDTRRFVVAPLAPAQVRERLGELLQDARLAGQVPWMQDKSVDGALREALVLELQCAAGAMVVWGIVERERGLFIGAALARETSETLDLEVLCVSQFWNQGVGDEAGLPVVEWLGYHEDLPH